MLVGRYDRADTGSVVLAAALGSKITYPIWHPVLIHDRHRAAILQCPHLGCIVTGRLTLESHG
jgi:hypothetical protein